MLRAPVIVVHPSRLFSEGLAKICEDGFFQLIYAGTSIDRVSLDNNSDCTPVFIVGGKSLALTVETIRAIRSHHQSSVIVVVGESSDAGEVTPALDAGANCYLRETITAELLLKTLELLTNGDIVLSAKSRQPSGSEGDPVGRVASLLNSPKLSSREATILSALVEGQSNKVIANRLNITEATVKVHVKAILRKIRAKNRTQAAIWAVDRSRPQ
jgi:two-component system, NarL family, nitrate/nitrite response regulator NarL